MLGEAGGEDEDAGNREKTTRGGAEGSTARWEACRSSRTKNNAWAFALGSHFGSDPKSNSEIFILGEQRGVVVEH